MVGYSDWILASNRYGFKIDKIKTSLPILTNCSMQVLTVLLKTCKLTSKMSIDAEFMHREKNDENVSVASARETGIQIMDVNGTSVHRSGDGKTAALQIFIKTNMGTNQGDILVLKLTIRDISGFRVAEDTVECFCIQHFCDYDRYLSEQDNNPAGITKSNTIWSPTDIRELTYHPCCLCMSFVIPGRRQYLNEKTPRIVEHVPGE